jgi:hypothetical protein
MSCGVSFIYSAVFSEVTLFFTSCFGCSAFFSSFFSDFFSAFFLLVTLFLGVSVGASGVVGLLLFTSSDCFLPLYWLLRSSNHFCIKKFTSLAFPKDSHSINCNIHSTGLLVNLPNHSILHRF